LRLVEEANHASTFSKTLLGGVSTIRIPVFQELEGDYFSPEYVVGYYGIDKVEFIEVCMKPYQRFLTSGFQPFDPVELARETEEITTREGPEGLRISGCEPTLAKEHLLSVLRYVMSSGYPLFILETNGILLGYDRGYAKQLAEFKDKLYVRVSFKAATPESFTARTGAIGESYKLPFNALKFLLYEGIYTRAAAMTDPSVMPTDERRILISMLDEIDPSADYSATMEEEQIDEYDTTMRRLKAFAEPEFAEKLERQIIDEATERFGNAG
jgi:uncharacterized Fe-S cluster-containing radical SAM superfamily protein